MYFNELLNLEFRKNNNQIITNYKLAKANHLDILKLINTK